VVFSLIVNGYRCNDERAMDAVDGFVSAMTAASLPPQPEPAPAAAGDRLP
jgi:hypothetical protein